MPLNLNNLAVEICRREGKKKQVNIAQVKEILKVLIEILSEEVTYDTREGFYLPIGSTLEKIEDKILEAYAKRQKKGVKAKKK